jgi:flagellar motor switch protein FliN/FliY
MADTPPAETPAPGATAGSAPSAGAAPIDPQSAEIPAGQDISFEMPAETAEDPSASSAVDQAAIDELLKQAQFDDVATASSEGNPFAGLEGLAESAGPAVETQPLELPNFQQVMQDAQVSSIDLLRDVELNVKIELGRSRMLVEDVLKLGEGSVVELDKLAGDPVDVFVNDRLVARGEVLVLNDNFCVRVNEIVAGLKEEAV